MTDIDYKELRENPQDVAKELTSINKLDLEGELEEVSRLATDVSTVLAMAQYELTRAENKLQETRSRVFNQIQKNQDQPAIGRTEHMVNEDPAVVQAEDEVAEKQYKVDVFKSLFFGLRDKKECIVEMSRLQRAEMSAY